MKDLIFFRFFFLHLDDYSFLFHKLSFAFLNNYFKRVFMFVW